MSNNNFIKGECQQCAGHLEFAADAVGETIVCPHCGQPTALAASISTNKTNTFRWLRAVVAGSLSVGLMLLVAMLFLRKHPAPAAIPAKPATVVATVKPATISGPAADEIRTNDFAISSIQLTRTTASSLIYAIGKIRNLSDHQRFGVKVEVELLDADQHSLGRTQDYHALLEPGATWQFKALVLASKAVSARLNAIAEDR